MDIPPVNRLKAIKAVANGVKSNVQQSVSKKEDQFSISSKVKETKAMVEEFKNKLINEPEDNSFIEENKKFVAEGFSPQTIEKTVDAMLQSKNE